MDEDKLVQFPLHESAEVEKGNDTRFYSELKAFSRVTELLDSANNTNMEVFSKLQGELPELTDQPPNFTDKIIYSEENHFEIQKMLMKASKDSLEKDDEFTMVNVLAEVFAKLSGDSRVLFRRLEKINDHLANMHKAIKQIESDIDNAINLVIDKKEWLLGKSGNEPVNYLQGMEPGSEEFNKVIIKDMIHTLEQSGFGFITDYIREKADGLEALTDMDMIIDLLKTMKGTVSSEVERVDAEWDIYANIIKSESKMGGLIEADSVRMQQQEGRYTYLSRQYGLDLENMKTRAGESKAQYKKSRRAA